MATAADSTTEIEIEADLLLYMAYLMIKSWNKSGHGSHVFLYFSGILCNTFIQYGPILYPNTELALNKQITFYACKIPV